MSVDSGSGCEIAYTLTGSLASFCKPGYESYGYGCQGCEEGEYGPDGIECVSCPAGFFSNVTLATNNSMDFPNSLNLILFCNIFIIFSSFKLLIVILQVHVMHVLQEHLHRTQGGISVIVVVEEHTPILLEILHVLHAQLVSITLVMSHNIINNQKRINVT